MGAVRPLGCRTRPLMRPFSASAEPPLPCARPRIRDDMHVIIRPSNVGRCLNCRSAMSPGVVGPPQLSGIQVWSQPPQELDSHPPLLRSRHEEAVGITRSWITPPPGAILREGYERPHPRAEVCPDCTKSAWREVVDLHGTAMKQCRINERTVTDVEELHATDAGQHPVRVHSSTRDQWRRDKRAPPLGTGVLKRR